MNKKANEQFKSNEKRMMEIFMNLLEEKDIRKITVREICEKVQVNRSTFYNHFLDVYDMLDKMMILHTHAMETLFSKGRSNVPRDNMRRILSYMKEHKILYRASLHSPLKDKMLVGFERLYKSYDVEDYENKDENERLTIDYKLYFIEQGLFSLISYWLDHDCQMDIESFLDVIHEFYCLD